MYPKSFLSHLKTQKVNMFNIGMTFLTLSLSAQLVAAKGRHLASQEENEELKHHIELLETTLRQAGLDVPTTQSIVEAETPSVESPPENGPLDQKNILV